MSISKCRSTPFLDISCQVDGCVRMLSSASPSSFSLVGSTFADKHEIRDMTVADEISICIGWIAGFDTCC